MKRIKEIRRLVSVLNVYRQQAVTGELTRQDEKDWRDMQTELEFLVDAEVRDQGKANLAK